jgi:hypothetical protein
MAQKGSIIEISGINGKKPQSRTIKMNIDASLHKDGTWGMGAVGRLMMTVRSWHQRHGSLMDSRMC